MTDTSVDKSRRSAVQNGCPSYYGVNRSDMYGENIYGSSMFSDEPPPLDDTIDDEDDLVFPIQTRKVVENEGQTASGSHVKNKSEDRNVISQTNGQRIAENSDFSANKRPNLKINQSVNGSVDINPLKSDNNSDLGNFASFDDFGEFSDVNNCDQSTDWFVSEQIPDGKDPRSESIILQSEAINSFSETAKDNSTDFKEALQLPSRLNSLSPQFSDDEEDNFAEFPTFGANSSSSSRNNTEPDVLPEEKWSTIWDDSIDDEFGDFQDLSSAEVFPYDNTNHKGSHAEDVDNRTSSSVYEQNDKMSRNEPLNKVKDEKKFYSSDNLSSDLESRTVERQDGNGKTIKSTGEVFSDSVGETENNNESTLNNSTLQKLGKGVPSVTSNIRENSFEKNSINVAGDASKFSQVRSNDILQDDNTHLGTQCSGKSGQNCEKAEMEKRSDNDNDVRDVKISRTQGAEDYEHVPSDILHNEINKPTSLLPPQIETCHNLGPSNEEYNNLTSFSDNSKDYHLFLVERNKTICEADDDFGDFNSVSVKDKNPTVNVSNFDLHSPTMSDDGFGDFNSSTNPELPSSSNKVRELTVDFSKFDPPSPTMSDDGFGDFNSSTNPELPSSSNKVKELTVDFSKFDPPSPTMSDDDFGDFNSSTNPELPTTSNKVKELTVDFSKFDPPSPTISDDDFGDFNSSSMNTDLEPPNSSNKVIDFCKFDPTSPTNSKNDFGGFDNSNCGNVGSFSSSEVTSTSSTKLSKFDPPSLKSDDDDDDDDDDEFGDFNSSNGNFSAFASSEHSSRPSASFSKSDLPSTKCEDDFGNFNSSANNTLFTNSSNIDTQQSGLDDDFGDFGSSDNFGSFPHSDNNIQTSTNFDKKDFGDFSSCTDKVETFGEFGNTENFSASGGRSTLSSKESKKATITYFPSKTTETTGSHPRSLQSCFPTISSSGRKSISLTINVLNTILSAHDNQKVEEVWELVRQAGSELSQQMLWAKSLSQCKLMTSLQVMPEWLPVSASLFRMPSSEPLPAFALGLGLLEPSKATISDRTVIMPPEKKDDDIFDMKVQDKSIFMTGNLSPKDKAVPASKKGDLKDSNSDTTSDTSSLDLEFFTPLTNIQTPPTPHKTDSKSVWEEDLFGLDFSQSLQEQSTADSNNEIRDMSEQETLKLLGKVTNLTLPLSLQEESLDLSDEAKHVLNKLENLSFMLSPVLMFPINIKSPIKE